MTVRHCSAWAEAVEEEAGAPVVVLTGGSGQLAEGESVGDIGVVEVPGGEVPAYHPGIAASLDQAGGHVGGCPGDRGQLPGFWVGHQQCVGEGGFAVLQVAPVGDVAG